MGDRELVHEGKTKLMFPAGKIHGGKGAAEMVAGFPANLFAETRFVADGLDVAKLAKEREQDSFQEVPIFGAAGEKAAQP